MDAASASSGGSRTIRKFPAPGLRRPKSEKGHPYGRGGCRLRNRWSGVHAERADGTASGLDVSVNPGWRLAASDVPELAIRQCSRGLPNLIGTIATHPNLVKKKTRRIAQNVEGILFKTSTYCGAVSGKPYMWAASNGGSETYEAAASTIPQARAFAARQHTSHGVPF